MHFKYVLRLSDSWTFLEQEGVSTVSGEPVSLPAGWHWLLLACVAAGTVQSRVQMGPENRVKIQGDAAATGFGS
jgi:hypothetical protein